MLLCSISTSFGFLNETYDDLDLGEMTSYETGMVLGDLVEIQTNVVHGGQALKMSNAVVSYDLATTQSLFWSSFWCWYAEAPTNNMASIDEFSSAVFFINSQQQLVVYSNRVPVVTDCVIPIEEWVRFDLVCDYQLMCWNLNVNETNVVAGVPFYSNSRVPLSLSFTHAEYSPLYIDEIVVVDEEPLAHVLDSDGDLLPDWWEQKYFGHITNAAAHQVNYDAYTAGLAPGEAFSITGFPPQWVGQPSRVYNIYSTTNLLDDFIFRTNLNGTSDMLYEEQNIHADTMFYRVEVELAE
jgi:hypothetical protein